MTILLVEDDSALGRAVSQHLEDAGLAARRAHRPSDDILRELLDASTTAAAIVTRDDIVALRYALLIEYLRPGIRLVVTIFDRTIADEVTRSVPNCTTLGMTDAVVPSLLAQTVDPSWMFMGRLGHRTIAVGSRDGGFSVRDLDGQGRRVRSLRQLNVAGRLRTLDYSSRSLVIGALGLLGVCLYDSLLGLAVLNETSVDAVWNSVRTLTTVGSSPEAAHGPGWYKISATVSMLIVLGFAALFTAGLVERLTSRRLTGFFGDRAIPHRDHVIVVGLGQVGLRLCMELQRLGIRVVAVERDDHAPCLPLARSAGVPVVLGRGGDRFLLRRLSLSKSKALVAVTSDGLENVAIAVAARGLAAEQRIILRAGGDSLVSESASLFQIGAVCDLHRNAAAYVAATLIGLDPLGVFEQGNQMFLVRRDLTILDLAGLIAARGTENRGAGRACVP